VDCGCIMLGINLYLCKNTKVSLLQNCPSLYDYVILCAVARMNTLRVTSLITGGPDVEYDYNNISAVYKTMYENASKITLNAMCRK